MLPTIRSKFAAVMLLSLGLGGAFGFAVGTSDISGSPEGMNPAVMAGLLTLVVMLLIERIVINPITCLTRDVVSLGRDTSGESGGRLRVTGKDEIATLGREFNNLLEHLDERKRLEAELLRLARHDSLTGLPNRVLFHEHLEHALARTRRGGDDLAVLCIDLDHFKHVNDTLGHPIGDRLLQTVSERLKECVRDTDVVARLGGDEFAVVAVAAGQPVGAVVLAERIIAALSKPFDLDGHHVVIGGSVGIAFAPSDGLESDTLMRAADLALYRAKGDGRGLCRFFEPDMDAKMQARRTLELDLRRALVTEEFELYYQPLINLKSNEVCGFEALLRWNHPERGRISPAEFIPIAEETGIIIPLGEWVLRHACAEAVQWPDDIKVAVNVSPAQFKSRSLALAVTSALAASGLPPQRLELEITESVLLNETEATLATLHQLRDLGVQISMDDFGTGYSSLSYLRSFPFDKIKIDRSFIRDLSETDESVAIVRAVAGLGRNLGMATTAEGVETDEQLDQLRDEGCTEVQGYLFSEPLPATDVISLLDKVRRQMRASSHPESPAPLEPRSAEVRHLRVAGTN
jgi:diguanylate cyclase (GGDEF)-like protein